GDLRLPGEAPWPAAGLLEAGRRAEALPGRAAVQRELRSDVSRRSDRDLLREVQQDLGACPARARSQRRQDLAAGGRPERDDGRSAVAPGERPDHRLDAIRVELAAGALVELLASLVRRQ